MTVDTTGEWPNGDGDDLMDDGDGGGSPPGGDGDDDE